MRAVAGRLCRRPNGAGVGRDGSRARGDVTSQPALDILLPRLRRDPVERAEDPSDWEAAAHLARKLGVAPLLYHELKKSCGNGVPAEALGRLEKGYNQALATNMLRLDQLAKVLAALRSAGIPTIILKGSALAETVYPSIGCRPMAEHPGLRPDNNVL